MNAALLFGHFHRDKKDRKIWINMDRGTEGKVDGDGAVGTAESTKRAQEIYAEYLQYLRSVSGPARQIPLVITFRNHSETVPGSGEELAVCEVAWNGFDRKVLKQAKAFYEELLQEYKPSYTLVLKWDELDEQYEFLNQKIKFKYTEGDAKASGYMAPQITRRAMTFFLNPSFGNNAGDIAIYAKIFAKLVEFLYNRP
jgi:hypothetical protein